MTRRLLSLAGAAALLVWVAAIARTQAGDAPKPASPVGARSGDRAPTPAVADDVQDLLYLGDKRPLRLRLPLRIDGKPFRHAWDDFLARLFAYADVNSDKVLSKEEAVRLPQAILLLNLLQGQGIFFG